MVSTSAREPPGEAEGQLHETEQLGVEVGPERPASPSACGFLRPDPYRYLKSPIRGAFFYLYLIVDVWSHRVVGWQVHDVESDKLAAALFEVTCVAMHFDSRGIVLHADNGGSTMVATLHPLGVLASFRRPHVSRDNPFTDVAAARRWVAGLTAWNNAFHLHGGIRTVTPDARHAGEEAAILARRHAVYEAAKAKNPGRWTSSTRNWTPVDEVYSSPAEHQSKRSDAPTLGRAAA